MRLAYGSWPSPVSAASLQEGALQIDFPSAEGGRVFWVEGRPGEGGRAALMMCPADGEPLEVSSPGANVRSRVHEYGGRPYAVRGDVAVFCDAVTQRLHRVTVGRAQAVGVTPDLDGAVLRWAGLEIDPSGSFVLAVQEDHRGSGGCLDALVRLDLGGDNRDGGSVLFSEADFVSAPRPSADWSRLAFVTWNHPNMPWHETTLWVGDLDDRGNLTGVRSVANGCAWTDPGWLPDGRLLCSGDRSGWWNLYAFDVAGSSPEPVSLLPRDADYGRPEWLLGHTTRAVLSDGRVVAERIEGGSGRYEIIDLASGEGQPMDDDLRVDCTSRSGGVVAAGDDVVIYSGFVDRPPMLVRVDLRTGRRRVVRDSSGTRSMPRLVSVAEQVSWRSVDGSTAYGHLYPPRNSDLHGLRGERPPLIVTCHGGPTSMAYGTFSPSNAFWTSRGFALLDVNYAGSSGFGRAYRERLDGQWGVADVGDVITGVSALADRGLVDRRRVAIMGASAGGFLALAALTFSETFTAGVSWFGIGDLELLARGTHKFEAHYLDRLVGPYPETATLYRARSPIHHLDRLTCPMLLLQGLDDRVVPPNQAEDMAAAVRAKGLPVALIRFEGEGHGFRQDRTRIAAYQSTEYFLSRVFGFTPADDPPAIPIANL